LDLLEACPRPCLSCLALAVRPRTRWLESTECARVAGRQSIRGTVLTHTWLLILGGQREEPMLADQNLFEGRRSIPVG
jgi:hypothetical protein